MDTATAAAAAALCLDAADVQRGSTVPPVPDVQIEPDKETSADQADAKTTEPVDSVNKVDLVDSLEKKIRKVPHPTSPDDILVASAVNHTNELPPPNPEGAIASIPLEKSHPTAFSRAPSRVPNMFDTSLDMSKRFGRVSTSEVLDYKEKADTISPENLFPWRSIGEFNHDGKGAPNTYNSANIRDYIIENFYGDLYFNVALVLGTCVFSWGFAYLGFSWWSLMFVFFCTSSVYRAEYRRFNRNIRDDLKRATVHETLSEKTESTLWLNTFMSKFWVIYMPVLSEQVLEIANPILEESAPGYGIEALSLEHFTLGSKAPAVRSVRTHTKGGKNMAEMELSFAFTPNDVSEMTPKEAKDKINPKISLGITLGKGFVSKTMSVIVEDINCSGRIRLMVEFGSTFPNIKTVSVQLLEAPAIDFVLKPVGGDTLGLDVMSFLPGLKTFVKSMINANIGPMFIAPNRFDIDVEELMKAQSNDAIGIVAVTIDAATKLKSSDFITSVVDPYIVINTDRIVPGATGIKRTSIKSNTENPRWNETILILVNTLDQKLTLDCFDFNDTRKDNLIGSVEIELSELLQHSKMENLSSPLKLGNHTKGSLKYSLNWVPVINQQLQATESGKSNPNDSEEDLLDIETRESSDSGIAKLTLQNIKNLDASLSPGVSISPSAELYMDGKLIKKFRTLKKINEPAWNETVEVIVPSKATSKFELKVYDTNSPKKSLLCRAENSLDDLIGLQSSGLDYITAEPQGQVHFYAQWKPIEAKKSFFEAKNQKSAIGALQLHIRDGLIKSELKGVGDIDPYFTISVNNRLYYRSRYISDINTPNFNTKVYIPVTSKSQIITLDLYDYQNVGKDRFIGTAQYSIKELLATVSGNFEKEFASSNINRWSLRDKKNRLTNDYIKTSVSFVPVIPVFTPEECKEITAKEAQLSLKKEQFDKKQAEYKLEMEKSPNDWEFVELKDPFEDEENKIKLKNRLTLDQLLKSDSGVLTLKLKKATLSKQSAFLHVLIDDVSFPFFTSFRAVNGKLSNDLATVFVRDLRNSTLTFRVSKSKYVKDTDCIISETTFKTNKLLDVGYNGPTKLTLNGSVAEVKFLFNPSSIGLPESETMLSTGYLNLTIVSADNLLSADRNGKSDPYTDIFVDGRKIFTTAIVKKSLSPVWNESVKVPIVSRFETDVIADVYDWDRTGDNDPLGSATLDVKSMEANTVYDWNLELSTQGTIRIRSEFFAEYIKPPVEIKEAKLSGMPLKVVGSVAGVGMGAAAGGLHVGGKLLRKGMNNDFVAKRIRSEKDESNSPSNSIDYDRSVPNNSYTAVPSNSLVETSAPESSFAASTTANSQLGVPNGHVRNNSVASSFARTLAPNGTHNGSVTIVSTENMTKSIQVRVSLTQNGRLKYILKTKTQKSDSEGIAVINETCLFKASPEANLVFGAVSHHTLSKDRDLGIAQIQLSDPQIQTDGNIAIKLGGGHIIVKINYGKQSEILLPPLPQL